MKVYSVLETQLTKKLAYSSFVERQYGSSGKLVSGKSINLLNSSNIVSLQNVEIE
jgi:hypothetical protein